MQGADSILEKIEMYNRPFKIRDRGKTTSNSRPTPDPRTDENKENEQNNCNSQKLKPQVATGSNAIPLGSKKERNHETTLTSTPSKDNTMSNITNNATDVDYDMEQDLLATAGNHC
jgi:hypothetical protein